MELARDFVFEFGGMPKSGKTTVVDIISHYLRRRGALVEEYHGGGRYCPVGKDNISGLNLYLAAQCVQRLTTIGYPAGLPTRIHLLDRGPVDRLIFTRALLSQGRLSESHAAAVRALFDMDDLRERVDGTFIFVTTAELSIERENKNKVLVADGRVMNTTMLDSLRSASESSASEGASVSCFVEQVDTGLADGRIRETAESVLRQMSHVAGLESLAP